MNKVLTPDRIDDYCSDFTLKTDESCWITVKNLSVYICPTDEDVVVDISPKNKEAEEVIASTYAYFNEGKEEE